MAYILRRLTPGWDMYPYLLTVPQRSVLYADLLLAQKSYLRVQNAERSGSLNAYSIAS